MASLVFTETPRSYSVINSLAMTINETAEDPFDKYSNLVSGPLTLDLQTDDENFTAQIGYSSASQGLWLKIFNSQNEEIQGVTVVENFPKNLILALDLRGYGLFYSKNTFFFVKINGDNIEYTMEEEMYEDLYSYVFGQDEDDE